MTESMTDAERLAALTVEHLTALLQEAFQESVAPYEAANRGETIYTAAGQRILAAWLLPRLQEEHHNPRPTPLTVEQLAALLREMLKADERGDPGVSLCACETCTETTATWLLPKLRDATLEPERAPDCGKALQNLPWDDDDPHAAPHEADCDYRPVHGHSQRHAPTCRRFSATESCSCGQPLYGVAST